MAWVITFLLLKNYYQYIFDAVKVPKIVEDDKTTPSDNNLKYEKF